MKKLNQYFNALSPAKQKQVLIAFITLFALLLLWSLCNNSLNIKPGYAPKYIGHTNDSLTK